MSTSSLILKLGGNSFLFTLAKVSRICEPSSRWPLASNHLGDSGRNLQVYNSDVWYTYKGNEICMYLTLYIGLFSNIIKWQWQQFTVISFDKTVESTFNYTAFCFQIMITLLIQVQFFLTAACIAPTIQVVSPVNYKRV
jgi:hypothetical protein